MNANYKKYKEKYYRLNVSFIKESISCNMLKKAKKKSTLVSNCLNMVFLAEKTTGKTVFELIKYYQQNERKPRLG